ncbi:hypothetical protein H9L12_10115 [Sphingomonas rhizophila]|uniref:Uncharacterized protein n=1 Tax=Sphingomonas rhizophila TaxID=2071607 RepID=A0A7G9S9V9_9SPHN|nr:hypothetical protein [Sphingomonas rhizophila]QNN64634.1 hypothetical protein H9L12_10115 [Sphingomonas rhizophila]
MNDRWSSLEDPIEAKLGGNVQWRSPLSGDDYAEYRDGEFLDIVDLGHLRSDLADFWPSRGPQWDALGVGPKGQVILVEAKAHVGEMCSPPTGASQASRRRITDNLNACAQLLGAREGHADWSRHFYQIANRLAHLRFLRERGVDAYLVLVNFLNDREMGGPSTPEAWEAAYQVAFHVLGLSKRHPLSRYIVDVYPDVATMRGQE